MPDSNEKNSSQVTVPEPHHGGQVLVRCGSCQQLLEVSIPPQMAQGSEFPIMPTASHSSEATSSHGLQQGRTLGRPSPHTGFYPRSAPDLGYQQHGTQTQFHHHQQQQHQYHQHQLQQQQHPHQHQQHHQHEQHETTTLRHPHFPHFPYANVIQQQQQHQQPQTPPVYPYHPGFVGDMSGGSAAGVPQGMSYPMGYSGGGLGDVGGLPQGMQLKPLREVKKKKKDRKPREPSPYNTFMREEVRRLKADNPSMDHRTAFKTAAVNWARAPSNATLILRRPTTTVATDCSSVLHREDGPGGGTHEYMSATGPTDRLDNIGGGTPTHASSQHWLPEADVDVSAAVAAAIASLEESLPSENLPNHEPEGFKSGEAGEPPEVPIDGLKSLVTRLGRHLEDHSDDVLGGSSVQDDEV